MSQRLVLNALEVDICRLFSLCEYQSSDITPIKKGNIYVNMTQVLICKVHEHDCKTKNVQNSPTHDIIENNSIQPYSFR